METHNVHVTCDTALGRYRIVDTYYVGRPARVLYSGNTEAAQSGIAWDGEPDLLFDYNQRFRELVRGVRPTSVLLLGGGAFTLPTALTQEFLDIKLDIVELDGGLVDIARQYFGFQPNSQTMVRIDDGSHFLATTGKTFDVIIIDVFIHAAIPAAFQTLETAQNLHRCLNKNGVVAMNAIGALKGTRSLLLRRLRKVLQESFREVLIFPAGTGLSSWIPQNYILTVQDGSRDLGAYLRYPAEPLPWL